MSASDAKMPISRKTTPAAKATADSSKAVKRENLLMMTNGSTTRLPSLTPPRDLTLGGRGTGANKKVFLPNLNVVRNKNAKVKTSKDTTQTRGRGRGGGRGGSRGGRGGNSSLIQTTGVFSEGAGAVNIRKSAAFSGGHKDQDDSPSTMRKPIIMKTDQKLDLKGVLSNERDILKILDDDCEEEEHKADIDRIPVQLKEAKWQYIKPDVKIETSSLDEANQDAVAVASQIQALHVAQQQSIPLPRYPQSVGEFMERTKPQILLLQLPITLPSVDENTDSPEPAKLLADTKTTAMPAADIQNKTVKQHILNGMEDGVLGRIVRYKSGKIKLFLGEMQFQMDLGVELSYLQDLMSINCNRDERSGNMINLGPLQAKLVAYPDWEQLIKK